MVAPIGFMWKHPKIESGRSQNYWLEDSQGLVSDCFIRFDTIIKRISTWSSQSIIFVRHGNKSSGCNYPMKLWEFNDQLAKIFVL